MRHKIHRFDPMMLLMIVVISGVTISLI